MNLAAAIDWRWRARGDAPEPRAAVAWGESAAQRLHARIAQLPEDAQAALSLTATRDVLVAVGDASALPWVDGVAYASPCADAPALWLPTLAEPDVPVDLLARALVAQHGREPLLLWPQPAAVVPLDRQLPASPGLLARIAERWQGS